MTTLSVRINEKTKEGKSVIAMLKLLAEKTNSLTVIEEVEDKRMGMLIAEGRKSGLAHTNRVLKKLGCFYKKRNAKKWNSEQWETKNFVSKENRACQ